MGPFLEAIKTKWAATAALTTAFGSYYLHHAPRSLTNAKYAVLSTTGNRVIPVTVCGTAAKKNITVPQIQFSILTTSEDTAMDDAKLITDAFDDFRPTLSSGTTFHMRRVTGPVFQDLDPVGDNEFGGYHMVFIVYEYAVDPT